MCCEFDPRLTRNNLAWACVTVTGQGHCHQETPGAACSSLPSRSHLAGGDDALSVQSCPDVHFVMYVFGYIHNEKKKKSVDTA